MVEGRVGDNVQTALAAAQIDDVQTEVSFRDVAITGPSGREDAVRAALADADGVAGVTYAPTDGVAEVASPVAIRLAGGRLTLTGAVPAAEDRDRILTAARSAVGASDVQNRLTVSGTEATPQSSAALGVLVDLIGAMNDDLTGGTASLDGDVLRLSGQLRVADAASVAAAVDRARGAGVRVVTTFRPTPSGGTRPAVVQRAVDDLLGQTTIAFATGAATLTADSRRTLGGIADVLDDALGRNLSLRVRIEGHTDDVGDPGDNRQLSLARARAVRTFLIDSGVPGDRLQAFGFGDARPLESNSSEAGRRANRRIAFRVLGG